MQLLNRAQALNWLRARSVPKAVLLGLGDYADDPNVGDRSAYDETSVFRAAGYGSITQPAAVIAAPIVTSGIAYTIYPINGQGGASLNANPKRVVFLAQNNSATGGPNLYVNFGNSAAPNNSILLVPGAGILFDISAPTNTAYLFFPSAGNGIYLEGAPVS